ncbi:MAG: ParB/RepB/Spo0J family partition protein [Desulfuromonadales bacterium]|nr:ParB/RepB/Spo0J family partition protein [Desulfuromonadales bacterium]
MANKQAFAPEPAAYEKGKLYDLNVSDVQPDPEQPRKYFDEQALAELAASITGHGVLQPILVRAGTEGGFIIVSGERRHQAAKNAGLATIPAIITDGEPAEISIIENLLREDLTAIEEAEGIERLRGQHDYALSDLSRVLGKAESTLSGILSLNRLPAEVKDDCRKDPKAILGILMEIAKQNTPEKMTALYAKYKEKGLTRGEIRKITAKPKPKSDDVPIDLSFVDQFYNRLDVLDITKLSADQKSALKITLTQLRSMAYQRLKLLQ